MPDLPHTPDHFDHYAMWRPVRLADATRPADPVRLSDASFREERFDIEKFHVRDYMDPREVADRVTDKRWEDHQTGHMIRQMQLLLAGKSLKEHTCRWPATWWDHYKLEGMPTWLKRLWFRKGTRLIQWKTYTMRALDMHPEVRINPADAQKGFVIIQHWEGKMPYPGTRYTP